MRVIFAAIDNPPTEMPDWIEYREMSNIKLTTMKSPTRDVVAKLLPPLQPSDLLT